MLRLLKLFSIFLLTALYFTWNVLVIIRLLNSHIPLQKTVFPPMFFNLLLYYGPLWFLFIGLAFFVFQFFAEKKFPIGFIRPPTFVYLFTFTVFVVTWVFFQNYEYYLAYLSPQVRNQFMRLLLTHLLAIFFGTLFFFMKRLSRHVIQLAFTLTLALFFSLSNYFIHISTPQPPLIKQAQLPASSPRKIKILLMDGLSLNFILNLSISQKLLNFDWIRQNGVVGRFRTIRPNYDLSLLTTILTGQKPFEYPIHSTNRFQLRDIQVEFDIFPRYIFFRNSAKLRLATFYKKWDLEPQDHIQTQFEANGLECISLTNPPTYPPYSSKNLQKNNTFMQFFSGIAAKQNRKIDYLKHAFFLDDFLVHHIPNFKISNIQYFVLHLAGLDAVTTHFYHYAHPEDFRNLSDTQIQEYGTILEKYYAYYDSIVGKMIGTMGDDEMLVIVSLFEAEPLPLWRRIFLNYIGKKDIFVYKPNSAPGLILMYEKKALRKQLFLPSLSIYDIYPTLLYYAGFPLTRSLNGEVMREIFIDRFILNNPLPLSPATRDILFP